MKRLKFKLPKHKKNLLNFESNLTILCSHFLKNYFKKKNSSFYFAMKSFTKNKPSYISKVNTYCIITGRTRYTTGKLNLSRQIFFEFCREGHIIGYHDV